MANNTSENPADKTVYFHNLDGLRTIAFLLVFFSHCESFPLGHKSKITTALYLLFGRGDVGVNFFFVLSGFLISYLILTEYERYKKIDIRSFYVRRILRIWPVYYTVIIISFLLSLLQKSFLSLEGTTPWMLGTFLTNFDRIGPDIRSLPLTVLWSVAVEEQFYLVLPLLILVFTKRVFYIFPLLIIGSVWFRMHEIGDIRTVLFHTFSVSGSLLLGCCCAWLVMYQGLAGFIAGLNKGIIISAYVIFAGFHLFRDFLFSGFAYNSWMFIVYSFFFAFFILEQNYATHSFYKMSRIKMLTAWGKYTYGLYAYHMIFISLLLACIPVYIHPQGNYFIYFGLWVVAFSASFLFARLSYYYMEKPFLKLKKRFTR